MIAMGPDKIFLLIPIAFDEERLTCSNTWLLPILDKYIYGTRLELFLDHILPVAKSVENASVTHPGDSRMGLESREGGHSGCPRMG